MTERIRIKIASGLSPEGRRAAIEAGLKQAARDIADEIVAEALKAATSKGSC